MTARQAACCPRAGPIPRRPAPKPAPGAGNGDGAAGASTIRVTRIQAIIRPSKLEALRAALSGHPWVGGMTIGEVKGFGRSRGHDALFRGAEYTIEFVPKLKVEIVVPDPLVPRIVHELEASMRTGRIGDGKIFVERLDEAVRIRTGDRGEEAL